MAIIQSPCKPKSRAGFFDDSTDHDATMTQALHTSTLTSLALLARGKVRDNYAVGTDRLLMVASDRISAFDVILGEPIPGKGANGAVLVQQTGPHLPQPPDR
jgi:hypothetical protein